MFPIFYLNKENHSDSKSSALDLAMKNNQIRAVEMIIKHIVTYQNRYISSYLFFDNEYNLLKLLRMGMCNVSVL